MKIQKSGLAGALKVLGKVCSVTSPVAAQRSIRFVGTGERVVAWATDGVEMVAMTLAAENEGAVDFAVEYGVLRELVRTAKGMVELQGAKIDWPEIEVVPAEAVTVPLPGDFPRWLANAAQLVDREDTRRVLQGIHLSPDGITAANGKQLLHIPVAWSLTRSITLPFPLALLTARVEGGGTLTVWGDRFQIEGDGLRWLGQAVPGQFPNWKQVMPQPNALDYAITIRDTGKLVAFLKTVPDHPPFHAIEFNVGTDGVTVIPADFPELSLALEAEFEKRSSPAFGRGRCWRSTSTSCCGCCSRGTVRFAPIRRGKSRWWRRAVTVNSSRCHYGSCRRKSRRFNRSPT